jgi:hypothetical protein
MDRITKIIPPHKNWKLKYKMKGRRYFCKMYCGDKPHTFYVLDDVNYKRYIDHQQFFTFNCIPVENVLTHAEQFYFDDKFSGNHLYFIIENNNDTESTVQFVAGPISSWETIW